MTATGIRDRLTAHGWLTAVAGILVLALLTACDVDIHIDDDDSNAIAGSGNPVTRDFALQDFDRIEVSNAFDVVVQQSDGYSVSVTVDDNLVDLLDVQVDNGELHIGLEPGTSLRSPHTLKARVSMPLLRAADASGASRLSLQGFEDETDFDLQLSGASFAEGGLNGAQVSIELSGASRVVLTGSAQTLALEVSGASTADLEDLDIARVSRVELSGASRATLSVSDAIDQIDLSGVSHLDYTGDPSLGDVDTSGASELRHR
jgi:hypothetical protein